MPHRTYGKEDIQGEGRRDGGIKRSRNGSGDNVGSNSMNYLWDRVILPSLEDLIILLRTEGKVWTAVGGNGNRLIRAKERNSVGNSYGRDAARVRIGARRDIIRCYKWAAFLVKVWWRGKRSTLIDRVGGAYGIPSQLYSTLGTTRSNSEDGNIKGVSLGVDW